MGGFNIIDALGGNSATNEYPLWLEYVKFVWNSIYVFLCVLVIFYGIAVQYTILQVFPLVLYIVLFFSLTLLGYCEALHYGVVAVEKWDMSQYKERFPLAYQCWTRCPSPEAVKRFLVGRQFFTIFQVYLISQVSLLPGLPADFLGMPATFSLMFLQTGMPTVMIILTFGQLIPQLYVEEYTLPFMNMYGCNFVISICNWAEYLGVCHYSWLLYYTVSGVVCHGLRSASLENDFNADEAQAKTEDVQGEDDLKPLGVWDIFRFSWSTFASFCSVFLILAGIGKGFAILPAPIGAQYVVFFVFMTLLFYLEGLMICIVATQFWDRETFKQLYPRAYMLHEIVNRPENLKRFIIGRQFFTVLSNILLSQVTAFPAWEHGNYDKYGFYIIIQSGLIGALTTLAHAQLCPELLAAEFPLRFMNMIGAYSVVRIALFIEAIGIGHCAWLIYFATRKLCCTYSAEEIRPGVLRVKSQEVMLVPESGKVEA